MGSRLRVRLNRLWRLVATGLSFAVFGVGGLVLGVIAVIVLRVMIPDRAAYGQAVRRLVSRAFRLFVAFMSAVGVLRWRIEGLEHWQPQRGYLVVANHPTLIDIVFLVGLFEGADCVVKAGVLRNPFWGLLVRSADYVSNENPAALLDEAVARLRAGRTVVAFPEGTRTTPGGRVLAGPAVSAIAVRAGCACLPVVITCEPLTLYKNLAWHQIPAERVDFRLRLSPAWDVGKAEGSLNDQRRAAREFGARLEDFYRRELGARVGVGPEVHDQAGVSPVL